MLYDLLIRAKEEKKENPWEREKRKEKKNACLPFRPVLAPPQDGRFFD